MNETMKIIHKGTSEIVVLAADCDPIEIVMGIPSKLFYYFLWWIKKFTKIEYKKLYFCSKF